MSYPKKVQEIAKELAAKYPSNPEKALKKWCQRIQKLSGFVEWQFSLVEQAGRHLINDCRHSTAQAIRKQTGVHGPAAKVIPGKETVKLIVRNLFDYPIDGRRLGDILWEELPKIADSQEAIANGFMFNANLCRMLYSNKPKKSAGCCVESGIPEKTVKMMFTSLQKIEEKQPATPSPLLKLAEPSKKSKRRNGAPAANDGTRIAPTTRVGKKKKTKVRQPA